MQVSRLEIFGFKSFMDRLLLPVEPGITAIVGPNGCGKSNVVDALRWVLGETRASSLRGGTLEDVIFNGTDKLRPLGLAEVSITVRSSEDNFFADLVSSNLEAELVVEGVEADSLASDENLEVTEDQELDLSQKIQDNLNEDGKPRLTVIEGSLDKTAVETAVETAVTEQDESTGEEATEAPTLLTRFSWLKSVSEVQVTRRLYRSGESEFFINRVPCRLKDIKEFFRAIGLGARAYTIVAQGEVSRIVTSKPEERRLMIEDAAGVLGFRDKIASANRRLKETELNISRLEDIEKEVSRQVTSLKRQANKAQNRQQLKDEIAELEQALFRSQFLELSEDFKVYQQQISEIAEREKQAESKMSALKAEEEHARNMLMTVDVEGDELRSKIDSIKEELNERSRQRSEQQARIGELKAFSLSRETEIKRLYERRSTLEERQRESADARSQLESQELELSSQLNQIDNRGEDELRDLSTKIEALKTSLKEKDALVRANRDKLISSRSSLGALHDQLIAASPVAQLKATLGEGGASGLSVASSGAKIFVEGLTVNPEYATALQAIAGERAQFLVANNPYEIARSFQQIVKSAGDQAKGLGLGILKAGIVSQARDIDFKVPFKPLRNFIEYADEFSNAVEIVFGAVYCCESLDQATTYFEGPDALDVTLVTLDGEVVTQDSFFSLKHEGGLLQLKVRAEALEKACAELEVSEEQLINDQKISATELEQAEAQHKVLFEEIRQRQVKLREIGNELGTIKGRLGAEKRVFDQLAQDIERTDQQIAEAKDKIASYTQEQAEVSELIKSLVPENEAELHEKLRTLNEEYLTLMNSVVLDG
ncbi:MAG: AAA family ATPase [Bdellovibrionota bacterium]